MKAHLQQFYQKSWRLARLLGSLAGYWKFHKTTGGLFFFFSDWSVGGATKVHAAIIEAVRHETPLVVLTGSSFTGTPLAKDRAFCSSFRAHANVLDISRYPLFSWRGQFVMGLIAGAINRHPRPTVLGSFTRYFYKLLPYLQPHVRRIDLIHNFGGQFEDISLPCVRDLDRRIVISEWLREGLRRQYAANGVDPALLERIVVIENGIKLPPGVSRDGGDAPLQVLYVGRGSKEKRVHLAGKVASACRAAQVPAEFTLVGDVRGAIDPQDQGACVFAGEITDEAALGGYYQQADVLLLTSSREGFPLVIMEAMAHGVVPICTNVGAIATHAQHMVNSILVAPEDEPQVVRTMVTAISGLEKNRDRLRALSGAARQHADRHFRLERSRDQFRAILLCAPPRVA